MTELEDLQREAEAVGVKVDGRWGVERLQAEIDLAKAAREANPAIGITVNAEAVQSEMLIKPAWQCVIEGCTGKRLPFPGAVICSGHENHYHRNGALRVARS
jgi:hypothetical protein